MNEEKIPKANKLKGILIVIALLLIIILPACYALFREYSQRHAGASVIEHEKR